MLALWYHIEGVPQPWTNVVVGGFDLNPRRAPGLFTETYKVRALPWLPIWPGLIINSIFWGVFAFVVVSILRWTRRTLRQRGNLCPACAYPIGASLVCTECGKVLPTRA